MLSVYFIIMLNVLGLNVVAPNRDIKTFLCIMILRIMILSITTLGITVLNTVCWYSGNGFYHAAFFYCYDECHRVDCCGAKLQS